MSRGEGGDSIRSISAFFLTVPGHSVVDIVQGRYNLKCRDTSFLSECIGRIDSMD
jgi:hypothetical protein